MIGQQGMYLAGGYMLTPAIAALITRLFFYKPRFKDAGLRFGKFKDYIRFWMYSLVITVISYGMYTLFGSISWDFSGEVFLNLLAQQFAAAGDDMMTSLPPGFTPQMMLWLFFIGSLTIFNIMSGLISGFGEEFGHRSLMFPLLFPDKPWLGLILGGTLWYAWHQPLLFLMPASAPVPLWQTSLNHLVLLIGSICTHIYLCYVYVKSQSIFVPSLAHITLNNAARALWYFVVLQNQFTANIAQVLAMVTVVAFLYCRREMEVFSEQPPVAVAIERKISNEYT
jgi:hypothetical protein